MTARDLKVTGQTYGENGPLNDLAEGFNDPGAPPSVPQNGGGGDSRPPLPPVQRPNVFAPSQGDPAPDPILPQDDLGVIRALYQKFPSEDLRRLLERAAEDMRSR